MSRRFFVALLVLAFLFLSIFSEKSIAAGQYCCAKSYKFEPATGKCIKTIGGQEGILFCSAGEDCYSFAGWNDRGICTAPGNTGQECCVVDQITNECKDAYGNISDKFCPQGEWCSPNKVWNLLDERFICVKGTEVALVAPKALCEFAGNKQTECEACVESDPTGQSVWTAIGCISVSPQGFVQTLLTFAIGIAGGIAFLMILFGAYSCMVSAGNPEKLNGCKEIITSALMGLLLVVFSTVILQIIGVDILGGFPGFGQ